MALETAISQQYFFCHNNGTNNTTNNNNNNNKDIYPLLLEAWPDNIIGNDSFFHPCLKLQDPLHFDNSSTLDYYNTTSTYFLDNQLDFDWNSYYNHHGINNHVNNNNTSIIPSLTFPNCTINHDLPPLNNYDYECWGLLNNSSPEEVSQAPNNEGCVAMELAPRPKQRRRARAKKNQEEIENQRMTHIAVERNRRKQMNDYLNEIRSLMPDSYVQRGDQASIVGAAINFVKELEHNLQNLSAKKQMKDQNLQTNNNLATSSTSSLLPFEDFFTFPQFSSISNNNNGEKDEDQMKPGHDISSHHQLDHAGVQGGGGGGGVDVEVTMVESHAHLKIRLRRSLKHLSKLVAGLHSLRLLILHLNVNTADDGVVLYSFSLKVEDETKLNSVDEIARAVYLLLGSIQGETTS